MPGLGNTPCIQVARENFEETSQRVTTFEIFDSRACLESPCRVPLTDITLKISQVYVTDAVPQIAEEKYNALSQSTRPQLKLNK